MCGCGEGRNVRLTRLALQALAAPRVEGGRSPWWARTSMDGARVRWAWAWWYGVPYPLRLVLWRWRGIRPSALPECGCLVAVKRMVKRRAA